MFFAVELLSKKTVLGRIWLAGTTKDTKRVLSRKEVERSNICALSDRVQNPQVPFALRISAHLLLGIVVIYRDKAKYVLGGVQDILTKLKSMQLRSSDIDLPFAKRQARFESITLGKRPQEIDHLTLLENGIDTSLLNMMPCLADGADFPGLVDPMDVENVLRGNAAMDELAETTRSIRVSHVAEIDLPDAAHAPDSLFAEAPLGEQDDDFLRRLSSIGGRVSLYEDNAPADILEMGIDDLELPTTEFNLAGDLAIDGVTNVPAQNDGEKTRESTSPKVRRKRRSRTSAPTIVDHVTELSNAVMRNQLEDTSDIVMDNVLTDRRPLATQKRSAKGGPFDLVCPFLTMPSGLKELATINDEVIGATTSGAEPEEDEVEDIENARRRETMATSHSGVSGLLDESGFATSENGRPSNVSAMTVVGNDVLELGGDLELPDNGMDFAPADMPMGDGMQLTTSLQGELSPQQTRTTDYELDEMTYESGSTRHALHMNDMSKKIFSFLSGRIADDGGKSSFFSIAEGSSVRSVVMTFYQMLVLKSNDLIDFHQSAPYGDISIELTASQ